MLRISFAVAVAVATVAAMAVGTAPTAQAGPQKYGRLVYIAPTEVFVERTFRTPGTRVNVFYSCKGNQQSDPDVRVLDINGIGLTAHLKCDGATHRARGSRDGSFPVDPGQVQTVRLEQNGSTFSAVSVWGLRY